MNHKKEVPDNAKNAALKARKVVLESMGQTKIEVLGVMKSLAEKKRKLNSYLLFIDVFT